MPKLLQINVTSNWGSTGKIAAGIGKTAINNGWDSIIAFGRNANSSDSDLIRIGNKRDIYYHLIRSRFFDSHGLASKNATLHFIKDIERISPDIIHLHNIHGYYLNYPLLFRFLKQWGGPIIWTLHDCWPFTGHCAYFDAVKCTKWQTQCSKCIQKASYPTSFIDRSFRNFNLKQEIFTSVLEQLTLVPVSDWLNNLLEFSFLKNARRSMIHNGIDLEIFRPTSTKKQQKKIILGVASIWEERKGLNDFIKLSSNLPVNYEIILVGVTPQQKKILPYNIKGIERTEDIKELVDLYSKATVFVNTTREDNFPTVNLESLACGTPVITYRTGGSPEAIDEYTGIVVDKGDVSSLKTAIETINLCSDRFTVTQCRNRAETYFRKEDKFNEYINLYNNLLQNKTS